MSYVKVAFRVRSLSAGPGKAVCYLIIARDHRAEAGECVGFETPVFSRAAEALQFALGFSGQCEQVGVVSAHATIAFRNVLATSASA